MVSVNRRRPRAIVTGVASGIGRACALGIIRNGGAVHGIDVVAADPELGRLPNFVGHVGSVDDADMWTHVVKTARSELGGIDGLANIAGAHLKAPLDETTLDDWQRILAVNLTGTFLGVRATRAHLVESRGAIVNVSSVLGVAGRADLAAYSASKGGIIALTRSLAAELGPAGVRVNCVCPGPIATPMLGGGVVERDPGFDISVFERRTLLGRVGRPEEVADVIMYLLSDEASYVTGVTMPVDGGRLAT